MMTLPLLQSRKSEEELGHSLQDGRDGISELYGGLNQFLYKVRSERSHPWRTENRLAETCTSVETVEKSPFGTIG